MRFKKALLGLLVAVLLLAPLAGNGYIVLTRNEWVLPGAVADFDFVAGRYYSYGFVGNIRNYFTVTRTQTSSNSSTNLTPASPSGFAYTTFAVGTLRLLNGVTAGGVFSEVSRTNVFLNSTVPVTQTTGSMAIGTWDLWVNGAGSATMSTGTGTGCGTGVATQGNPVTITITIAGTCTVTISGALNAVMLEQQVSTLAGPGSFVVTAGATAFRNNDNIQFPTGGAIQALSASGTGTVMCQITRPHVATGTACFAGTVTTNDRFITAGSSGGSFLSFSHTNVQLTALDGGSPSDPTTDKVVIAWDGAGRCIVWNAGTPVCDANTFAPATVVFAFGVNGGVNPNVPGKRLTFWSTRLSSATLQLLTK